MAIDRKEVFGASFEQLKHRVKMRYGEDVTPGDCVPDSSKSAIATITMRNNITTIETGVGEIIVYVEK